MLRFALTILSVVALFSFVGCGKSSMSATQIESAQSKIDQATADFGMKDYVGAKKLLTEALSSGGLNPDVSAEAYLMRAKCFMEEGDLVAALADLDNAELGAADELELVKLRAEYWKLSGDEAKAIEAQQLLDELTYR